LGQQEKWKTLKLKEVGAGDGENKELLGEQLAIY